MAIKVALELYSVRHDLAKDLEGTLQKVKAMGYAGVEFAGLYAYPAERVKKALADTGLEVVGWHTPLHYLQGDLFYATVAYHQAVGNTRLIVPAMPEEVYKQGWEKAAEVLEAIGQKLRPYGMKTGYHNHNFEFAPKDNAPWEVLFKNTSGQVIHQIDNGNCIWGDGDPVALVRAFPGRSQTVHLKPYSRTNAFDAMIGADDNDWPAFFAACREVGGTEWYIVEYEFEGRYTALEGVEVFIKAFRDKYIATGIA